MEKVEKIEKLLHKNKQKQNEKDLKEQFLSLPENGEDKIELDDTLINKMENDEIILVDHQEVNKQELADEVSKGQRTLKKEKSEESSEESSSESSSEESEMVNDKFDDVGLLQDPVEEAKPTEKSSNKKDKNMVGRSRSDNVEEKDNEKIIDQSNDIVADYLDSAGAKEIILDPVSSKAQYILGQ